jgi:hypothetical protein
MFTAFTVEPRRVDCTTAVAVISVEPCTVENPMVDTIILEALTVEPVSVEKSPLFTFAVVAVRREVSSVLPWLVEKPMVEATSVDVLIDEPYKEE